MDRATQLVIQILSSFGVSANAIPESSTEQRADISAHDHDSHYVIEVKSKTDSQAAIGERERILEQGAVVSWATGTSHSNCVDGILKDGRSQVDATPKASHAFRLLWFHADGIDHAARWQQAYSTFYGRVHLWDLDADSDVVAECFYFDWAASYSMPSIDALILSDRKSAQLCLNEFSPHCSECRQTGLYRRFADANSAVDPIAMAADGRIIACRYTGSRKREVEVLAALQKQTGKTYRVIRFTQYSAAARVEGRGPGETGS